MVGFIVSIISVLWVVSSVVSIVVKSSLLDCVLSGLTSCLYFRYVPDIKVMYARIYDINFILFLLFTDFTPIQIVMNILYLN